MAKITSNNKYTSTANLRAIEFAEGDVLIDQVGRVGIKTGGHVVRAQLDGSLLVIELGRSYDTFTKAPTGAYFTVTAE